MVPLERRLSQNPGIFKISSNKLICKCCLVEVKNKSSSINQHLKTSNHCQNVIRSRGHQPTQQTATNFVRLLILALVSANIALWKLTFKPFRAVLNSYLQVIY